MELRIIYIKFLIERVILLSIEMENRTSSFRILNIILKIVISERTMFKIYISFIENTQIFNYLVKEKKHSPQNN